MYVSGIVGGSTMIRSLLRLSSTTEPYLTNQYYSFLTVLDILHHDYGFIFLFILEMLRALNQSSRAHFSLATKPAYITVPFVNDNTFI